MTSDLSTSFTFTFTPTYPSTARDVETPRMTSQPVFSIFLCSPLASGTWRTPGLCIHSVMLSSHLFFWLPCLLPPFIHCTSLTSDKLCLSNCYYPSYLCPSLLICPSSCSRSLPPSLSFLEGSVEKYLHRFKHTKTTTPNTHTDTQTQTHTQTHTHTDTHTHRHTHTHTCARARTHTNTHTK